MIILFLLIYRNETIRNYKRKEIEQNENNEINQKEISIDKDDKIKEYLKKIENLLLFFKNIIISPEFAIPSINEE